MFYKFGFFSTSSVNNEDLTPLDVAVMTNHVPMAKMLLARGARENPKCKFEQLFLLKKRVNTSHFSILHGKLKCHSSEILKILIMKELG